MAPLRLIKDLPDNFLVMNGDVLTDLDFGAFFDNHVINKNIFTISSYKRLIQSEFGVLEVNDKNILTGFKEKPEINYNVSMGIYMVNKKVIECIPENTFYGFDHLMIDLIKYGNNIKIEEFNGYWLDIGRPDDYVKAIDEFDKFKDIFLK